MAPFALAWSGRLAKAKAEQRRMAMEMAASYKAEVDRRAGEQEARTKEAAESLRTLRDRTRSRIAKQKVR
jgi:hypothetical protein